MALLFAYKKLSYSRINQPVYNVIVSMAKIITIVTPHLLGYTPPYYQVRYRIALANVDVPEDDDQFLNYLCKFKIVEWFDCALK